MIERVWSKVSAWCLVVAFVTLFAPALAAPAHAQLSKLDTYSLIDGLRREGMGDLLLHLLETENINDPVLRELARAAQLLLDYQGLSREAEDMRDVDPDRARELDAAALASFNRALDAYRTLIRDNRDAVQRPMWQTDYAELLLAEYLQVARRNAAEFYEFGVPTAEQKQAFEDTVAEAYMQLAEAAYTFLRQETTLPKNDREHLEQRINTGLWHRMMDLYFKTKTAYFLAHAAYYTWLLPDEHSYYQTLDPNNFRVRGQMGDAPRERVRLLDEAIKKLEDLAADEGRDEYGVRSAARTITGRALVGRNKINDALAVYDKVIGEAKFDLQDLLAHLARARALEDQGQSSRSFETLLGLDRHGQVRASLFMRLLAVDARHNTLLRAADKLPDDQRRAGVARAYGVYLDLFNDPELDAGTVQGLKNHVYRRWVSAIPDGADLSNVPSVVVAAVGEMLRNEGQNEMVQANRLAADGEDRRASEIRATALPKLKRAVDVNTTLLERESLSPALRGQAMYNLAVAKFWVGRQGEQTEIVAAAALMTDVAEQFPELRIANEAMTNALVLLQRYHVQARRTEGVPEGYERAMWLGLEKFAALPVVDDQRLYFAEEVLQVDGRHVDALRVLKGAPFDHPSYFLAQAGLLNSLMQMFAAAPVEEKAALAEQVDTEAKRIAEEADREQANPGNRSIDDIRTAAGTAGLARADVAAGQGEFDQAVQLLEGFEERFGNDEELIRDALGRRIMFRAKAGDFDEVSAEAEQMMKAWPDAAAGVIERVVTQLDALIQQLERTARESLVEREKLEAKARAKQVATTAEALAKLLLDWAMIQPGLRDDPLALLPFQLIRAQAMVVAGKGDEAVGLMESIYNTPERDENGNPLVGEDGEPALIFATDADVIMQLAEAYHCKGTSDPAHHQLLIDRAAPRYFELINGLQPDADNKYPPMYWKSWMRWFQIADTVNQQTESIWLSVRQLKEMDPSLGGEQFRFVMEALSNKHAP